LWASGDVQAEWAGRAITIITGGDHSLSAKRPLSRQVSTSGQAQVYLRAADSWASTTSALVSMNVTSVFVTCEQARNSEVVGLSALWHDQDGETSSDVDVSTDLDTVRVS